MKGVIDRFEGNQAVILIEKQNEEIIIQKDHLPPTVEVGTWLHITKSDENDWQFKVDEDATNEAATKVGDLLSQLRRKSGQSKFRRDD